MIGTGILGATTLAQEKPHIHSQQVASAGRFSVICSGWSEAVGFSELAGFSSTVESKDYFSHNRYRHSLTKQIGRALPPTISLKRGVDKAGFSRLFLWHQMARDNIPYAKTVCWFTIHDASGATMMLCVMHNAWCSKIELDPAKAGAAEVIQMKVTIECDSIDAA